MVTNAFSRLNWTSVKTLVERLLRSLNPKMLTYEEFKCVPNGFVQDMLKVIELKKKWDIDLTKLELKILCYSRKLRLEVASKTTSTCQLQNDLS